jgi:hypothetical protein
LRVQQLLSPLADALLPMGIEILEPHQVEGDATRSIRALERFEQDSGISRAGVFPLVRSG